MASSGGVARGYLRPGFSRSPPFLMIGLIITAGISAFNYWNLSAQYSDLVKEITELQDHVQIITLKRETAEKRVDALQQRLSESADQLGQMKISLDEKVRQTKLKEEEIERLKFEAKLAVELSKSHNTSLEELRLIKIELERYKFNNSLLQEKEYVLHSTVIDLKSKMAEMSQMLSQTKESAQFRAPAIQTLNNDKTADDVRGQLKLLKPGSVHIFATGFRGITMHPGGPLVFVPAQ